MERKFKLIVMLAFGLIIQTGTECRVADSRAEGLLTNPDMEIDSGWTNYGTPSFNVRSSEQKHGGKKSRKFKVDAAMDYARPLQDGSVSVLRMGCMVEVSACPFGYLLEAGRHSTG